MHSIEMNLGDKNDVTLDGISVETSPHVRPKRWCENNIKMDSQEVGNEGEAWILLK
jgi:hypothetical protein